MVRVTIDSTVLDKLGGLQGPVDFCDERGRLLGHFTSAEDRSLYDKFKSPNSIEEIERRLAEEGGRELKDILRDLENRQ